jgi:hypothetical protein
MRNHNATRAIIARNTSPPTTPPAIAPALDFDLLVDATVVDGIGINTLVLVGIADEVNAEALASDNQGISFRCSRPNLLWLTLLSSCYAEVITCL